MSWVQVIGLSLPALLLILTFSNVAENTALRQNAGTVHPKGSGHQVFVPGPEASNFFKRRSRRSGRYYAELLAEQQVKIAASRLWREQNEERSNAYENYAEEQRDEQKERSRERNEQVREFRYDGLYPRRSWFH